MTLGAFNQKVYPSGRPGGVTEGQAHDVDDCWVVATIWAGAAVGGEARPTIRDFRKAAGDPDDGVRDGGSLDEVYAGAVHFFPELRPSRFQSRSMGTLMTALEQGRTASIAVWSGFLPPNMRYGFNGSHQVGLGYADGALLMNPLQPKDSKPTPITASALERAATASALAHNGVMRAVLFSPAKEETMEIDPSGPVLGSATMDEDWRLWRVRDDTAIPVGKGVTFRVRGVVRYHDPDGAGGKPGFEGYLVSYKGEAHIVPGGKASFTLGGS